ncbi:TPA: amidase domain-containing protein [Staphylococcus aureus]|uniref:amidase domain-containing protein n=1 Tax=Staphylococcus aureus TaxID=1280 RepID=UPI0007C59648|nr:amidase domain-containing protein [Staphylococcus aureus]AWQ35561.1 CHAP domain-containing protein [Staphylococcus aureus]MBH4579933.1 amidase domain-containing protein [Staphylococcus aureus]MBH4584846.1 amidase domain-containing protein [Staphylococcus aureus]MBH4587976.1 amidase domain-containing protein [Staphylococcus aureus]MBH4590474.1 amidase domain-containing protein [Staphylococcus aureus]
MPKNKILIYLLSTTLVLPTLVSPTAYADTPQKDTTAKTTSHDSKKSNDDETSKDTTSKDIDKADNNNTSNQDNNDKKFKTIDDSTSDSNNIIDFIYKNLPQTNINQLLTKNKYDDNYSLTTLIQNLFNLNSDISDYEQPRNGEKSTNDSNKNSDNSIKNDTDTQSSKQDKADNQKAPKSNNTKPSTSNKQPNSPKPTQPNQSNSQPASDDRANQKSSSKDNQSMSDSALDSILDQYSEDAKKTQKDYASQSKKDKNEKSNTKNPQLPTQDELKHKSKPAQSFNNDVNQKDTRATSLFETDPSISNNDDSGQFNVVDSKDTRQFVKSIAKDAHRIGQDNDIYASVMIAQAILESDSGRSALAKSPNHNLFGIKGAFEGNSVPFNTLEADGNQLYSINAGFRKYPSTKESLKDYSDLIKNGIDGNRTIYKPTWKSEADSYKDATSHLSKTYATDPNYAKKLNSIIKHYQLTQFDDERMPDLDKYERSIKDYDDSSDEFKPFREVSDSMPYPHGQCTWYVYNRMKQFGTSISGDLGDAHNWNNRAQYRDYQVSHTPKRHAAVVFEAGQFGADQHYGHVAFVEKVNSDGSIVISESNVKGLGIISHRTINASAAEELSYITGK